VNCTLYAGLKKNLKKNTHNTSIIPARINNKMLDTTALLVSSNIGVYNAECMADKAACSRELRCFFSVTTKQQRRVSQYELCVNDSARDKTFQQVYDLGALLGEGGYANVYKCIHKGNNYDYAVKEINEEEYDEGFQSLKQEIAVMKALYDCPHVVRLHDVFRQGGLCCLVMEGLKGGDLLDALYRKGTFSEKEAKKVSRTLLEAVAYCHKKEIAHRDIKLENILLISEESDTDIKLCDFGCSKVLTGEPDCLRTMCGSLQYCAPEVVDNENGYDQQCDLWSTGVVIYGLLAGYLPFDGAHNVLSSMICSGKYGFPDQQWSDISQEPKDLIQNLLVVNRKERFTAHQALNSNWLSISQRRRVTIAHAPSARVIFRSSRFLSQSCTALLAS
jgi:serine/threonine protein kinase